MVSTNGDRQKVETPSLTAVSSGPALGLFPLDTAILQSRVFAIYQIMLGWKTYKYYYETDELPNPSPTQPKEN